MNTRIKELRKSLGLTMEKFGEPIGLKKNSISQIESGINAPSNQTLLAICRVYDVNEVWLRTGEGEMHSQVSKNDRYIINLAKLSKEENAFVQNTINFLAESDPEKLKLIQDILKEILGIE